MNPKALALAALRDPRLQKFVRDALEAAIAAVGALAITAPVNMADAQREAIVAAVAVASAVIAVARRELLPIIVASIVSGPSTPPPSGTGLG